MKRLQISGKVLARNTAWNIIGQGAPMLVAIFAIPLLIKGFGTERFGVLSLAWMVVGYFNMFDLGLGLALTKLVAEKLGASQNEEIPALVWTSLFLMLVLGLVGALVLGLLSPWLVQDMLSVPEALQHETLHAFYLLALSLPVVITTAGFGSILAAHQRFGLINAVRIAIGFFSFLAPLLVLPFSQSLFPVVAVLMLGRIVTWFTYLLLCLYVMPLLRHGITLQRAMIRPLVAFGSWATVTNIVGPLMSYLDRFLIGSMISVAAVAYYVIPYEMVTKLWIIPVALASVLYPAFAASVVQDRRRTAVLLGRGVKYTFVAMFPLTLLIVTLAPEGIDLWLGGEFAKNSSRVLQWLAVGVFVNSMAHTPFALVQGIGRPDLTANLHLIELPFYLVAIWWMIGTHGIEGAAIVWVLRLTVDMVILFGIVQRFLPSSASLIRRMAFTMGAALFTLALASLPTGIGTKGLFLLLVLLAFALITWFVILAPGERARVQSRLKAVQLFT